MKKMLVFVTMAMVCLAVFISQAAAEWRVNGFYVQHRTYYENSSEGWVSGFTVKDSETGDFPEISDVKATLYYGSQKVAITYSADDHWTFFGRYDECLANITRKSVELDRFWTGKSSAAFVPGEYILYVSVCGKDIEPVSFKFCGQVFLPDPDKLYWQVWWNEDLYVYLWPTGHFPPINGGGMQLKIYAKAPGNKKNYQIIDTLPGHFSLDYYPASLLSYLRDKGVKQLEITPYFRTNDNSVRAYGVPTFIDID